MKINNYFLHVTENRFQIPDPYPDMFHLQDNVHPTYMSLIKKVHHNKLRMDKVG